MNNVASYYEQAELAFAAYFNLSPGMAIDDYELALRDDGDGMSPAQASAFASRWEVVDQIIAKARLDNAEGQAYRYAFYKLNPFAVSGSSVLYDGINTHGELDLYDPASGTGALSERYLRDRAAMLTWQNQFNTDDVEPIGDTFVKLQGGTPFYFEDFTSNAITTRMRIGGGDSVNAVIRPLDDFNLVVFGSENDDLLTGQGKAGRLYGGAGHALLLTRKSWKEAA